jgi:uncharacterized protein
MSFMKKILSLSLTVLLSACGNSQPRTFISIGTGSQTGVYYPVGGAIKKLVEDAPENTLNVSAKASLGSVQNIQDVMNGSVTFGIAQSDRQFQAYNGLDNWEGDPQSELRFVFSLHPEVITLIAADDSGIRSLADLKGKRVNLGSPGSGHRGNAEAILASLGINPDEEMHAESLTVGECASRIQDNQLDAYFYTVGHPNGSITEASTGRRKVRFVPITGMEKLIADAPYYAVTRVPVERYPQAVQDGEVPSVGMLTTLITRSDTPDEIVYALVKAVFENLDALKLQHPALQGLTPEGMLLGGNAPFHPGAEKYYREAGLLK